jgi:hypothetical protein
MERSDSKVARITLDEHDVENALKEYVKRHHPDTPGQNCDINVSFVFDYNPLAELAIVEFFK